ncbi:FIG00776878: hypothetical protein [hydrothermal vent metagenome]|uniref:DUF1638 domain-containing protein n=1 Tax=hydrothermal vent metagenome TaxID=652676 RepID=A0A3B0S7F9_9ZZZZ
MTDVNIAPREKFDFSKGTGNVLLIACGALGREIIDLIEINHWSNYDVTCLPAKWHNTPDLIVDGVRDKIHASKDKYQKIFVVYGDCGTGGMLDKMLKEEGVERIEGPHCYAFFSGKDMVAKHYDNDITSFFLTDYLARHFDKLIWQGMGLDRHPQLRDAYFGNYKSVVYLAQTKDNDLQEKAKAAAEKLGLEYEYRFTGYGELAEELVKRS